MNRHTYVTPEKYDLWQQMRFKRESFNQWKADIRSERAPVRDSAEALADILRPVILFLAKGSGHNAKFTRGSPIGTLHMRAWVILYCVRPDLIEGETMRAAAKRFGVDNSRLRDIMRDFRACVPNYDPCTDARRVAYADPQAVGEARRQGVLRSWAERKRRTAA